MNPGREMPLVVSIRRFGDAKLGALKLRTRGSGIKPAELELMEGSRNAKLPVSVAGTGESASLIVEAVGPDGQIIGESVPVIVRVKADKEADEK